MPKPPANRQNDLPDSSLGHVFWRTTLLWQRIVGDALNTLDLTHVQFVLLSGIDWMTMHHTDVTQTMLSKHAKADMMMTSKVLRTLEKKQLIKRTTHSIDARANVLELTNKGRDILEKAMIVMDEIENQFFSRIGKNKQQSFYSNLNNILVHYTNG